MTLPNPDRLRSILERLAEADPEGMPLWDLLEWDAASHRVSLETAHRNLEDLSTLQRLISMGAPYHIRTTASGRPIYEPTVRVTEEGRKYLLSVTVARQP